MFVENDVLPLHPASSVKAADHLIKLKKENINNVWPVFEFIIELWKKKTPKSWDSFVIEAETTRNTRANKHASNKKEGLRYTLDIPEWVILAFRKVYSVEELPMDKTFYREVWKRYPIFRIAESY